jgi:hypothetical protein
MLLHLDVELVVAPQQGQLGADMGKSRMDPLEVSVVLDYL